MKRIVIAVLAILMTASIAFAEVNVKEICSVNREFAVKVMELKNAGVPKSFFYKDTGLSQYPTEVIAMIVTTVEIAYDTEDVSPELFGLAIEAACVKNVHYLFDNK